MIDIFKIKRKKVNLKRGSEIVQVLLVSAIFLVLVCTVFYDTISGMVVSVTDEITSWYNTNSAVIFAEPTQGIASSDS